MPSQSAASLQVLPIAKTILQFINNKLTKLIKIATYQFIAFSKFNSQPLSVVQEHDYNSCQQLTGSKKPLWAMSLAQKLITLHALRIEQGKYSADMCNKVISLDAVCIKKGREINSLLQILLWK